MISSLLRFIKRFAVLLPVLVVGYVSIFNVFPRFNDHLPAILAIIATYVLGAYIILPAFIRLVRVLFPRQHLPLYCITRDGFASDPLNIGILGTRQEVIAAMGEAGWYGADKLTFKSGAQLILSTIYGWSYPRGPISNLFLFGRMQDLSFQLPIEDGAPGSRHHVRFWATTLDTTKNVSVRSINWQHRKAHLMNDRLLWVGAASRDVGVTFIRHNAQLTHLVDPDTDAERDLLAKQLRKVDGVKRAQTIKLREPYKLTNIRGLKQYLRTDGRMTILEITAANLDSPKPQQK